MNRIGSLLKKIIIPYKSNNHKELLSLKNNWNLLMEEESKYSTPGYITRDGSQYLLMIFVKPHFLLALRKNIIEVEKKINIYTLKKYKIILQSKLFIGNQQCYK